MIFLMSFFKYKIIDSLTIKKYHLVNHIEENTLELFKIMLWKPSFSTIKKHYAIKDSIKNKDGQPKMVFRLKNIQEKFDGKKFTLLMDFMRGLVVRVLDRT